MSDESEENYETGTLVIENVRLDVMGAFMDIFEAQLAEKPLNSVLHDVLKHAMDGHIGAATATRIIGEYRDGTRYGTGPEALQKVFPSTKIEPRNKSVLRSNLDDFGI